MHLPDHYLDPMTATATALFSGGAVAYALVRFRSEAATKAIPLAATSAVIFAAQMVNFPVAAGTSGHLIGGALAGMLLGPWAGLIAMAVVLSVQAIVLGDGGILALGANILNMGVIGVMFGVGANRLLRTGSRAVTGRSSKPYFGPALAAAVAGWLSVVVAALACALEMAASGTFAAAEVIPRMLGIHAIIGISEAAATALVAVIVIAFTCHESSGLSRANAGLELAGGGLRPAHGLSAYGFALALMIGALSPFASTLPDGLEHVAESLSADERF